VKRGNHKRRIVGSQAEHVCEKEGQIIPPDEKKTDTPGAEELKSQPLARAIWKDTEKETK